MTKSINIKKLGSKNITIIALLTPLILLALAALYIIGVAVTAPVFDRIDQHKFVTLDQRMKQLFLDIDTKANGEDDWNYKVACSANRSGWMKTGDYNCVTSISMQKTVTSVDEIGKLQTKYYPIIDGYNSLSAKTELDPQPAGVFGRKFVVSSAEKNYVEKNSGVGCNYSIMLYQNSEDPELTSDAYGAEINNGVGKAIISLRCSDKANKSWYTLSDSADLLIP